MKNEYKTTKRLSLISQNLVVNELLKRHYTVYRPIVDDEGTDYLIEGDNKITHIQVKCSSLIKRHNNRPDAFIFRLDRQYKDGINFDYLLFVGFSNPVRFFIIPKESCKGFIQIPIKKDSKYTKYENNWKQLKKQPN